MATSSFLGTTTGLSAPTATPFGASHPDLHNGRVPRVPAAPREGSAPAERAAAAVFYPHGRTDGGLLALSPQTETNTLSVITRRRLSAINESARAAQGACFNGVGGVPKTHTPHPSSPSPAAAHAVGFQRKKLGTEVAGMRPWGTGQDRAVLPEDARPR